MLFILKESRELEIYQSYFKRSNLQLKGVSKKMNEKKNFSS